MLYIFLAALFISFVVLWWGGRILVDTIGDFSKIFKISSALLGFLFAAIATSLPELFVVIAAHLRGATGMAVGALLGSNIFDIACVLSISVFAGGAIYIRKKRMFFEAVLILLGSLIATFYIFIKGSLIWYSGLLLIVFYIITIWLIFKYRVKIVGGFKTTLEQEKKKEKKYVPKTGFWNSKTGVVLRLFGIVGLILVASDFAVNIAVEFTKILSLSIETIGVTLIAFGASLPTLSVGVNAVKEKRYALALGNSLGSILVQGTLFLGFLIVAAGKPINILSFLGILPFLIIVYAIVGFCIIKYKKIGLIPAVLMFIVFIAFFIYQLSVVR